MLSCIRKSFLKLRYAILLVLFLVPTFAFAANNDPFRGGREAVNPKQSAGVGQSTGAMTYSYPLTIPPGRNGVQPNLSFNYSSDDKRQDSIFGYGWSMSIPYIEHVNKLGTNNLYNNLYSQDRSHTFFTSSLSGELLPFINSTPLGGSFLGISLETSPFAFIQVGDETPSPSVEATPALSPTSVSSETARSFHNFQDTFLPTHVYHQNEVAGWNAARIEGAQAAKVPISGFPVASSKGESTVSNVNTLTTEPTYFAEIDQKGIVLRVLAIDQATVNTGLWGDPKNWVQTSKDGSAGKTYAGKGYIYGKEKDDFTAPAPVISTESVMPASFYVASSTQI